MSVRRFVEYQGKHYDVGTRLKFKASAYGYYQGIKEGIIEEFINTTVYVKATDGETYQYSTIIQSLTENIVEIVHPVYYVEKELQGSGRRCPPDWQVEMGVTWYIIIMVVCALFKERLLAWFFVTGYFVLWLNGFMNGGEK